MTKTFVVDPSFDANITTSYFLSIRSSSDGLSFCVLDPVVNTYIAYAHFPFDHKDEHGAQTQELLLTEAFLNMPYKKVLFMTESLQATLVPTALYSKTKHHELLNLCHTNTEEEVEVLAHKIKMADAWNLFSIPKFMYYLVKNQFENVTFYQQYSPFVESSLISGQNMKSKHIFHIGLHDSFFDIVAIESRHLKLCNSFRYTNENDFVYFVLFTFEQLKLSPDETIIHMHGINNRQNPYYLALKKYLRQTQTVTIGSHFQYSHSLKDIHKEKHHNLFNLAICV